MLSQVELFIIYNVTTNPVFHILPTCIIIIMQMKWSHMYWGCPYTLICTSGQVADRISFSFVGCCRSCWFIDPTSWCFSKQCLFHVMKSGNSKSILNGLYFISVPLLIALSESIFLQSFVLSVSSWMTQCDQELTPLEILHRHYLSE